jgi:uncharacterized cupin superfamily protein
VSGDPHTKTWNLHTSDDGKILAGIWESKPGAKGTWTVHENLRKYYVFALGH